jgi:hypothetical protein
MSDEIVNHGHNGHETEYEHEDLGTRGIFVFLFGLVVSGIVIYFIVIGMYKFLDDHQRSQMTTSSPLDASTTVADRHIDFAPDQDDYVQNKFKDNGAPLLEHDERGELRKFLVDQENQLNSYGWVDKDAGVAHIPITRAMDLMVNKLPVYSPSGATVEKAAPKGKGSAK